MLKRLATPTLARIRNKLVCGSLAVGLLGGLMTLLSAQVPSFLQPPFQNRTYNASVSFAPATTATADFFSLTGAANITARVTRLACSATTTAAGLPILSVIYRSAIPSVAGTSTSPTAVPNDPADTTAAAVVPRAYTVAPTPGAAVGTIRITPLFTTPTGTPAATVEVVWDFSTRGVERQGIMLRTAAQVLAINTTWPAGPAVNCNATWTEAP